MIDAARRQAMQAISVLRAEHEGVLVVLTQLERAVAAAERALPVPADVFTDIGEFFSVFVDRCHHSKEEAIVFPRLARSAHGDVASHLEEEHGRGRELAAAYAAAVRGYTPGDTASGQRLAAAARTYAAFLREHIDEEDRELFPAMEGTLAATDAVLVAAFERIEEEQIGPGTHERLHHLIDDLPGRIDPFV
jgi:hemerythrin-like domain-containing protein